MPHSEWNQMAGEAVRVWEYGEISVPSSQFYCEPKAPQKIIQILKNKLEFLNI